MKKNEDKPVIEKIEEQEETKEVILKAPFGEWYNINIVRLQEEYLKNNELEFLEFAQQEYKIYLEERI